MLLRVILSTIPLCELALSAPVNRPISKASDCALGDRHSDPCRNTAVPDHHPLVCSSTLRSIGLEHESHSTSEKTPSFDHSDSTCHVLQWTCMQSPDVATASYSSSYPTDLQEHRVTWLDFATDSPCPNTCSFCRYQLGCTWQEEAFFSFCCDENTQESTPPAGTDEASPFIANCRHPPTRISSIIPSSTQQSMPLQSDMPTLYDTNDSDGTNNEAEDEFMEPGNITKSPQIFKVFLLTGSAFLLISSIALYSYHPSLRQFLDVYILKPVRFRAGETNLVRWASEDFGLLDGEEDIMVNETDAMDDNDIDEQIPLKPIPTRNSFLVNYGSTRFGYRK